MAQIADLAERIDRSRVAAAPTLPIGKPVAAPAAKSLPEARHSPDFSAVYWCGADYTFSPKQAQVICELWGAMEAGTPDVPQAHLLSEAESELKRLDKLFMPGGIVHPAWGTMIMPSGKGFYRLAPLGTSDEVAASS